MSVGYRIPIYQPSLAGREREYVNRCLESTWISSRGEFLPKFEASFADYLGARHAAAVCNGTVALHLALVALGIGPGDEVIVPTLTYIASVNAITYTGATPVFAESLLSSWQLDPKSVRGKISPRTKAIMAVHLYGHPCDMDELVSLATEHRLFLIEDCAEAIGTKFNGRHVGTFGDIATFSFFGNKTITTGEGGMVVTSDETLQERVVKYRGQGLAKHREYWHDVIGFNYRMTNICAAIGLGQLERVDEILAKKARIASWYDYALSDLPVTRHSAVGNVSHSYWMYSILVQRAEDRAPIRDLLRSAGVETRPAFHPVHTMPMYAGNFQRFPIAERIGWLGINLPSWPDLPHADVQYIAEVIARYYKSNARASATTL